MLGQLDTLLLSVCSLPYVLKRKKKMPKITEETGQTNNTTTTQRREPLKRTPDLKPRNTKSNEVMYICISEYVHLTWSFRIPACLFTPRIIRPVDLRYHGFLVLWIRVTWFLVPWFLDMIFFFFYFSCQIYHRINLRRQGLPALRIYATRNIWN